MTDPRSQNLHLSDNPINGHDWTSNLHNVRLRGDAAIALLLDQDRSQENDPAALNLLNHFCKMIVNEWQFYILLTALALANSFHLKWRILVQDTATVQRSYERFLERISNSKLVWGLRHPQSGWATCQSNNIENTDVLLFWSDRAYAKRCCKGEWEVFIPTAIELDEFINNWLQGMCKDGVLVGPNWDGNLIGCEVEPGEVARRLTLHWRQMRMSCHLWYINRSTRTASFNEFWVSQKPD